MHFRKTLISLTIVVLPSTLVAYSDMSCDEMLARTGATFKTDDVKDDMTVSNFHIDPEAVDYIRDHYSFTKDGEPMIMAITPQSLAKYTLRLELEDLNVSDGKFAEIVNNHFASLPSEIEYEWGVGGILRNEVLNEEIVTIDGIDWYLHDDVKSLLEGRVLRLKNEQFIFDPALESNPPIIENEVGTRGKISKEQAAEALIAIDKNFEDL